MNWLDPIGASLSLICTYYFSQAKRRAWLLSMVAIAVNSLLYWQKGIYGHLGLEAIYLCSMAYGWYRWSPHYTSQIRSIRCLRPKHAILLGCVAGAAVLIMGRILSFTDSDVPYWDACTTILSLVAQWLLCIKVIECWIVWFVVDALMAGLQFYKDIPFHSAIRWTYLILAVVGFYRWRKLQQSQNGFSRTV